MEITLVDQFGWSLKEIDDTDIETLIPFVFEYPRIKRKKGEKEHRKQIFADEANWL